MDTNYQYHLTFNGKFTNETYIEYFDPEDFERYKTSKPNQSNCTDALETLRSALNNGEITDENCEKTFQKIRKVLATERCKPDCEPGCKPKCNPCEKQNESKKLYFLEEYERTINIVKDIIREWSCETKTKDLCDRIKCQWDNLPKNNRILFHGQRGSGKTSVTMSVAKSLEGHCIDDNTFKVLPIINPGYFDADTNILKTIISNMFEMAKCIIRKEDDDSQRNEHEELLKQFEEVYRLLGCIESPNKEKHTLETLNEISKASGMREAMQKLVDKFIKILPCKAKYLVLVIDDVDMSVAYAATMLEQINKFLELDNLFILISANLDQLYNEMREHYSKAFEKTLGDENQSPSIDVEDLASKYLLKLFPASRRINVERPVSKLLQTELIINDENKGCLQKAVLSLIWDKTRLLYLPKDAENTLHPVIPTNLRELAQLINLLLGMEKVETGQDEKKQMLFADKRAYENCQRNINTFKNYFLNIWVPTHLSVDEEQVFLNIPSDITEINKHLINSINVIGTKNKKRLMSREVGLDMIVRNAEDVNIDRDIYTMVSPNDPRFVKANKISDIFNRPSNYSYGDLLLMIDKYETYFESEEDRRFSNAVKIYYSILLFETMFFKSNNVKYDKTEFAVVKAKNEDVIPIQRLIGGTVYYPNYFEIITSKYFTQKGPSFDAKRAFYHKLLTQKKELVGRGYPFFTVLYYGDIRPDRSETKHIYDTTYDSNADVNGTKYVTFDILSILSNMLNPWHTISRLDDSTRCSEWEKDLESWGNYCAIMGDSIVTPNSILPFYSVDIMLLILKKQISDEKVDQTGWIRDGVLKENRRIIDEIRDFFFDRNKIIELINKRRIEIKVDYDQGSSNTYCVDALIKRVEKKAKEANVGEKGLVSSNISKVYYDMTITVREKNGLSSMIIVGDHSDPIFKVIADSGKEYVRPFVLDSVVKNVQTILFPLIECYWMLTSKCPEKDERNMTERIPLADRFIDHCIAIILSEYSGGKKDRDTLIKGLKKYSTVSEMYKYLVDQLWENAATEALIRKQIQIRIRFRDNVYHYYKELFSLLKDSPFIDSVQQAVYNSVFEKAGELFIMESKC